MHYICRHNNDADTVWALYKYRACVHKKALTYGYGNPHSKGLITVSGLLWESLHQWNDVFLVNWGPGGHFKNTYDLLNPRALKISMLYKNCTFQCMCKIFGVEFHRFPLKFHTKYFTQTLKTNILFTGESLRALRFKSSQAFLWSSKSFTLPQPANHFFIKLNLLRVVNTEISHACCSLCW